METLYDAWQKQSSGDFFAGVRLLLTHNPNAVTSRILIRFQTLLTTGAEPDDYLVGKLTHALRDSPAVQLFELSDIEPEIHHSGPIITIRQPGLSDGKIRVEEAIPLHKQHSHFHAMLVSAKSDSERADHARVIMEDILPTLDNLYDAARHQGDQPEPKRKKDGVQTIRKLQALRTRVSLLKNKLIPNAPSVARKAELEKELQLKVAEIETIQNEIA